MLLRRLGNKKKLAKKILPYFPKHTIYIELFFGAGGMFFNKPLAKYNFLNDLDNDVFNLFMVLKEKKEELIEAVQSMPVHSSLFNYWKTHEETRDVWKAVRFLMLSNFGYMGKPDTFAFVGHHSSKKVLLSNTKKTFDYIIRQDSDTSFMNCDFRDVLKNISYNPKRPNQRRTSFIYADPPYLGTGDNYKDSFTESDFIDLLDVLQDSKIKFACSEFNNPFVSHRKGFKYTYSR